ncbi:MAG: chemotaxis-specific protein-glutamate methyltransferase CheB [Desulfurivibrio sp.]|nr:MAG: chemotaxis-specific protein-glutamate methyltransferase CheB [Desulfurivibrio sp.]
MKVLVVDRAVGFRRLMAEALTGIAGAEVAGTAPSAALALRKLAQLPFDVVLLDSETNEADCLDQMQRDFSQVVVILVGSSASRNSHAAVRALEKGAMAFVEKPGKAEGEQALQQLRSELLPLFRLLKTRSLTRQQRHRPRQESPPRQQQPSPGPASRKVTAAPPSGDLEVMAVGISTGGPNALKQLIADLPGDFPLPVLIVLHMPMEFTANLARDLDRRSQLRVREAREGDQVVPGLVLLAPGGRHMLVRREGGRVVVGLDDGPKENSCRPAVDVLFRSLADCYGEGAVLAVIMTGMGNDGLRGMRQLKAKKCYSLSQSEASCVVYGMPKAVDDAGLSDESVDLEQMAERICEIVHVRDSENTNIPSLRRNDL